MSGSERLSDLMIDARTASATGACHVGFLCNADIPSKDGGTDQDRPRPTSATCAPEDLLLVPSFPPDVGILDWHRHTELTDSGRQPSDVARHPLTLGYTCLILVKRRW